MKDLKDHVLISEDTAHTIITILRLVTCDNENELVSETIVSLEKALTQDLGGMVVVPALPHEKNFKYSPWYCIANEMTYMLTMGRRACPEELYRTAKVTYNMLSAAQKEKNDA